MSRVVWHITMSLMPRRPLYFAVATVERRELDESGPLASLRYRVRR
jgi:hypothetical protein